jgi:Fur family ferric uptake transcriptional regulator
MSCGSIYVPQLRARGYRMTPQRLAILHVLHHAGTHLSPTEIFASAKKDFPRLTEPTVYRTLEFLTANGLARLARKGRGHGHLVYEITQHDHHHLVCRSCGAEMEVRHQLLEELYRELEAASGYRLTDSHITFMGLCPHCQKGN